MADLLLFLNEIYDTKEKSLEQLKQWNKIWYEEVSPEKYVDSLGNPAFCVQEYGKDYGQIFSAPRVAGLRKFFKTRISA